ncbi:15125_t:CDS:2, partial [Funneliformis geosporum]
RQGFYDYQQKVEKAEELFKNRQYIFFKSKSEIVKKRLLRLDFAKLAQKNTITPGIRHGKHLEDRLEEELRKNNFIPLRLTLIKEKGPWRNLKKQVLQKSHNEIILNNFPAFTHNTYFRSPYGSQNYPDFLIFTSQYIIPIELKATDKEYHKQDRSSKEIIQAAAKAGVKYILNTGQDMPTNQLLLSQLVEFPNLYEKQLTNPRIIAIGEIELAQKYNLPVLLHIRGEEEEPKFSEVFNEAYEIVKETGINKARKFIDLGFYVSFAGNITYKNAKLKKKWGGALVKIPLENLVVETDAPYLTPEPERGKINYPQNIIYTLKKIAEIKKMEPEKVAEKIYANTLRLLGISQ